jgi:hypothetical protein
MLQHPEAYSEADRNRLVQALCVALDDVTGEENRSPYGDADVPPEAGDLADYDPDRWLEGAWE